MYKTELRLDPLTHAWTIFSESRALPPAYHSVLAETGKPNALRAGLEHLDGVGAHEIMIEDNGSFVRFCPYASRVPFAMATGSHVNSLWPETAAKTHCAMEVFA